VKDQIGNTHMVVKNPAGGADNVAKDPAKDKDLEDEGSIVEMSKHSKSNYIYQDESLILKHRNEVVVRYHLLFPCIQLVNKWLDRI